MKINPFHPRFLLTKNSIVNRHAYAKRLLKKQHADDMVSIASVANRHSYLHQLCQKHGTDKGHTNLQTHNFGKRRGRTHDYAAIYDLLFWQKRNHIKNVLECGIATLNRADGVNPTDSEVTALGPSLRMWQEYFPNAKIVGIDIDPNCLFTDERIETYQVDQTNPQSIKQFLSQIGDRKFDIIVDDGLHKYHAGISLFQNIVERLEDDGVYVIEDIRQREVWDYTEYFKNTTYMARFFLMPRTETTIGWPFLIITKQPGK